MDDVRPADDKPAAATATPLADAADPPPLDRTAAMPHRFVGALLILTLLACASVIGINRLVDPLWYFDGNVVTHKNLFFNERQGKANLYYRVHAKYDCIIFGASSATTLDTSGLGGPSCFNFAISAGTFEEFAAYARYVKWLGPAPRLIVIAVDWPNLLRRPAPPQIPNYVRQLAPPEPFYGPYLSLKVFSHSAGELLSPIYDQRYYQAGSFICDIGPEHARYRPSATEGLPPGAVQFGDPKLQYIAQIRELFPAARIVGYAPYFGASHTAGLYLTGRLKDYAAARYEIAKTLDDFYDFALPSEETIATAETYDGLHYSATANRPIAGALFGAPAPGAVRIDGLTEADYVALYERRTAEFVSRYNLTPAPERRAAR